MEEAAIVRSYLERLGLDPHAANTYLALAELGPATALQIQRRTQDSRTQVYRHLESLQQYGLASVEKLSYGSLYRALPIENTEGTLVSREADTAKLKSDLGGVVAAMQLLAGAHKSDPATVQHYYGLAGIKQANWNLTKADKEYFVFEVAHIVDHFDETFGRRHRERCVERGLVSHDLTNSRVITKAELEPLDTSKTLYRYIDPAVLTINFEMYIYNDVVTLLDYDPAKMQAIEIHHPTLNAMMRQIYQTLWNQATPIHIG